MQHYVGLDLHSSNVYCGVLDEQGGRVFGKRVPNDLASIIRWLEPYRESTQQIAVESTYNWYWLVDGLQDAGYDVRLANPAAFQQYKGLKHADDKSDAFWLAEMLRLQILPQGYIYPRDERPVRDLLRRRMRLVQLRTMQLVSFQSSLMRHGYRPPTAAKIKRMDLSDVNAFFEDEHLLLAGTTNIEVVQFLNQKIAVLEKAAFKQVQLKPSCEKLMSVPGIGKILAMTIMLETGDINRLKKAGNYTSYCRGVRAVHTSNDKKKANNNKKNGNKYLGWAFVEAANFAIRHNSEAARYFHRKAAKRNKAVAIKALASKLSKACFYIMRDNVNFNQEKIFGAAAVNRNGDW